MIRRFSSRRERLDGSFLNPRLSGAQSYDRIAGYFSSSILEVAGEALDSLSGPARIVCNSGLTKADVAVARTAQAAMRQEWCASRPETRPPLAQPRFQRLYDYLVSGKLEVRVVPDEVFGLVHGKAGVITLANGDATAFMGSANESFSAYRRNYELIWEDDSPDAVAWVREEFDTLWQSPFAVPLADFVVADIKRTADREEIGDVDEWREADEPSPASVFVEAPVYRREAGMWEHQKHFVKLAFDAHLGPHGARFVLADQVGLGKTVQLAMAAQLMALAGERGVLVLAPKTLLVQWQQELQSLLGLPSAVWTGKGWRDEQGVDHPGAGAEAIARCPRRLGIVSTGLITHGGDVCDVLAGGQYECVILDEAHKARRRTLSGAKVWQTAQPNKLLAFMQRVAPRTHSLLLATATPVQLHPVEAFDLLDLLSRGSDAVLGAPGSPWRRPQESLELILGKLPMPEAFDERWEWLRNPLPPASESRVFQRLRRSLHAPDDVAYVAGTDVTKLRPADRRDVNDQFPDLITRHSPYIRMIVRRTRGYLENTLNPETGTPYLDPVRVQLHGEGEGGTLQLPAYLEEAYHHAEAFCALLGKRTNTGFFRTMLLRRMGSTMVAGFNTAEKILGGWGELSEDETNEDEQPDSGLRQLTSAERAELQRLADAMRINQARDPKLAKVEQLLSDGDWLRHGCIIFSQYYDSAMWLAEQLSVTRPTLDVGLYAGGSRSGLWRGGTFAACPRETLKAQVATGELRLLVGTDAAAEGLNLQRLGTLINLDLPWNPSRLEQRKGRIQRIGQARATVDIYNMRYAGSVEDRVHQLLSERLKDIADMFGQLPDILEDAWVNVALGRIEQARATIDAVPERHPFELRYSEVTPIDWESCAVVLSDEAKRVALCKGWS